MSYAIYSQWPISQGGYSYVRRTYVHVIGGEKWFDIRTMFTLQEPAIAQLVRCLDDGTEVVEAESEPFTASFKWHVITTNLPDGHYVLRYVSKYSSLPVGLIIDNRGEVPSQDTPHWVPVVPFNGLGADETAYGWIKWPGHKPPIKTHPLVPREAEPWGERLVEEDQWVEQLSYLENPYGAPREWASTIEGHICISPQQTYYENDRASLHLCTSRSGEHGEVKHGHVDEIRLGDDGNLYVLEAQGRFSRIYPDGKCETVFGWDLPQDVLTLRGNTHLAWRTKQEQAKARHQFIGTCDKPLYKAFDFAMHKRTGDVYFADTMNHRIARWEKATGHLSTFAGSPDGVKGYADGKGTNALFNRPRGVLFDDFGNGDNLIIFDEYNHALRQSDLDGNVTTIVRSSNPVGEHSMMDTAHMRAMTKDGAFGEAAFFHVNKGDWDSEGNILAFCHHEMSVRKFDFKNRTVTRVCWVPSGHSNMEVSWGTCKVDRWGALGPVDDFFTCSWFANSDRRWDKHGNLIGRFTATGTNKDNISTCGPAQYVDFPTYLQGLCIEPKGALVVGGTAGAGILRITKRKDTDPTVSDYPRFARGYNLFRNQGPNGEPALDLFYGHYGQNWYGGPGFVEMGQMTVEELQQEFSQYRPGIGLDVVADIHYWAQTMAAFSGCSAVPDEEPNEPPEDEEPEPEPDNSAILAAMAEIQAGINTAQNALDDLSDLIDGG